jgi:hypothetical protein
MVKVGTLWVCLITCTAACGVAAQDTDPLPSWNDSTSKKSIVDFVTTVTQEGGTNFVPVSERIATFDNDGTLWAEQPVYVQVAFAFDRVKALSSQHPEWKQQQPFKAVLDGDMKAVAAAGERGLLEIIAATHAGNTTEEFETIVRDWMNTARHPTTERLYTEMVYQPMLELLTYLRAKGFKTFIVSGGGVEFIRPWAERIYGVPPEQVVGSRQRSPTRIARDGPCSSAYQKPTSSTTAQGNRSAFTRRSAGVRSPPSAIRTAISRCSSGPRQAAVHGSGFSSITPTPRASGLTTGGHISAP